MTYSQPQQQQPQYRPNRSALWVNSRKTAANQPDYKGNVEISYALLQELTNAFNSGQYQQDSGGQPCIKLDFALYAQQGGVSTAGKAKPILSGQLSTVAETQQSLAARQQAAQQYQPQQPQAQPGYAPQPQYQQPQAPMPQQPQYQQPQPQQPPAQPQYAPAPAPMPQAHPAYQQPPQPQVPAPVAPPAMPQPMPGAIHGQQPSALPPNF